MPATDSPDAQATAHALDEARRAVADLTASLRRAERAVAAVGANTTPAPPTEVLTAQRINIVEPDGTLRLVLTSSALLPALILRGREHAHPNRPPLAGLVFFNDEATEQGGLVFAGSSTDGQVSSGVHLSFDNYEQDQALVLSSHDDGHDQRVAWLEFVDRPEWSLADILEEAPADGDAQRLTADLPQAVKRMRLARESDGSVGLTLRDASGRPRIVLRVPATGDPSIDVLSEDGTTVARMPSQ